VEIINTAHELDVDCLVTVGAGSISDACKNVKMGHANNVKTRDDFLKLRAKIDFDSGSIELPDIPLNPPTLKLICIPTSLSAGEYNSKSGGLDKGSGKKYPFFQPDCMPDVIICDPYLAKKTPDWVWLSTGVRSLDHAVETLGSINMDLKDPLLAKAHQAAEEAVGLLVKGLILCKGDGDNIAARDMCQRGAWRASLAVVRGIPLGGSHAIGHILGPVGHVPHGVTSCVMCPAVLRYNYKVNGRQQGQMKEILVREGIVDKLGLQNEKDLPLWKILSVFIKSIGMPQSLAEVNIGPDKFPLIAKETLTDFWSRTNPIPLETPEQVMEILKMAA
jgi:maleylacetate reductase